MTTTRPTTWRGRVNGALAALTGMQMTRVDPDPAVPPPAEPAKKPAAAKPKPAAASFPKDVPAADIEIAKAVKNRTQTAYDKLYALIDATRFISRHKIEGDIVECGVWRGGSMMALAKTLVEEGDTERNIYLFDTYEGMPPPTDLDRRVNDGSPAQDLLEKYDKSSAVWAYATLEDVQKGMASVPYPQDKIHFIKGLVEDTIPDGAPEKISLLRLDTDWYSSTAHELKHLYDRLTPGGVIIFDDYGYWEGARKAVDEFLAATGEQLLLTRIASGRIAVKPRT